MKDARSSLDRQVMRVGFFWQQEQPVQRPQGGKVLAAFSEQRVWKSHRNEGEISGGGAWGGRRVGLWWVFQAFRVWIQFDRV